MTLRTRQESEVLAETIVCRICGGAKPYDQFHKAGKSHFLCADGVRRERVCRACKAEKFQESDPRAKLIWPAAKRAKEKGIDFQITIEDIMIPSYCPLLGIPLKRGVGKATANSPSLDRINNHYGYIRGNVMVISRKANAMKQDMPIEAFLLMAHNLRKMFGHSDSYSEWHVAFRALCPDLFDP